jgi:hypothetical protein
MTDVASHYLDEARRQFRGHKRMGERAMEQVPEMLPDVIRPARRIEIARHLSVSPGVGVRKQST